MEIDNGDNITISDVFKYMVAFKSDMSAKLDEKMSSLEEKIQVKVSDIEKEMVKNQKENKDLFEETNMRMRKLEEDMKKMKGPTRGMETLRKMELEMMEREGEEDKREREKEKMRKKKREEEYRERKREEERKMRKNKAGKVAEDLQRELADASDRGGAEARNWETQASDWLDEQVRPVNIELREEDGKRKKKRDGKGMKRLMNWFGESDDSEQSSEEEDDSWNVIDRKEKNMRKKKIIEKKKKEKRESVARKAKNIIGVGPIKKSSIDHFQKQGKNFEEAKIAALEEYLNFYLHYDEEELRDLKIGATQISQKNDFLYVAFEAFEDIKEIHIRVASCRDE